MPALRPALVRSPLVLSWDMPNCVTRYALLCTIQQELSEEEQYARLKREAAAAAEEEVGVLEQRMLEEQQQILKEMEEKRHAYDKLLGQLRQRKEAAEKRRALRLTHEQRLQQRQTNGLQGLIGQFDADRQLLEQALALEAERQYKGARQRVLLRAAERSQRLQQKRLVEKQRFLVNQNEIRRRAVALVRRAPTSCLLSSSNRNYKCRSGAHSCPATSVHQLVVLCQSVRRILCLHISPE